MKKKGFTLIELLAVIVILAVLSLILTPVVLRIINNSREESRKESLKLYGSAVESAVLNHQMTSKNKILGVYTTSDDGHTLTNTLTNEKITVDFSKSKVECESIVVEASGEIKLNSCTVGGSDKIYSYSTFDEEVKVAGEDEVANKPCTRQTDTDGFDTVTCGTETFYVMSETNDTITMLTKYNLDVGDVNGKFHESNHDYYRKVERETEATGIQSELARGRINIEVGEYQYGLVSFSETDYWNEECHDSDSPAVAIECTLKPQYESGYIYDSNSSLYQYIVNYERYLNSIGVSVNEARLMSETEAYSLKNNAWISSTNYYLGTVKYDIDVAAVDPDGYYLTSNTAYEGQGGLRPVIVIPKSNIK